MACDGRGLSAQGGTGRERVRTGVQRFLAQSMEPLFATGIEDFSAASVSEVHGVSSLGGNRRAPRF